LFQHPQVVLRHFNKVLNNSPSLYTILVYEPICHCGE